MRSKTFKTAIFKKALLFFLISVLYSSILWSQSEPCGFGAAMQAAMEDPAYANQIAAFDQEMINNPTKSQPQTDEYEIPVVVHIVHDNGLENISDAQVYEAIDRANQQLAGIEGGFDTNIKLTLASIDPQGNCTNGIVRAQTNNPDFEPFSIAVDANMKNISRWPSEDYMNIWVVRCILPDNDCSDASGVAGYSYLPPINSGVDGVVVRYDYFGTTGASVQNFTNTLVHETGHYLGLYHVWGEDSLPFDELCNNCNPILGDRVPDTEPCCSHLPLSGCDPYLDMCGSNYCNCEASDPTWEYPKENYMSYNHECQDRLTEGQATRMYFTLNEYRANLWSDENRICTGLNKTSMNTPIVQDETWSVSSLPNNGDITIIGNLTVESGATLRIEPGVIVRFCGDSKLIIKPDATVFLKGTLTNSCGIPWKGVEVWGNSSASQYCVDGECAQGILYANPGAIIENAKIGVQLWGVDKLNDAGGRVRGSSATFRNNTVAVEFAPYVNFWPYTFPAGWQGQPRDYAASFTACSFVNDDDYQNTEPFDAFLKMVGINGITISGSSFINTQTLSDATEIEDYGHGIHATDSGFKVYARCATQTYPCTSYISSTFEGLGKGIYTAKIGGNQPYILKQAEFRNCYVGVHNSAVTSGTLLFNDFYLDNIPNIGVTTDQIGVIFENAISGFTLEENDFIGEIGNTTTVGTLCKSTWEYNNVIRRNNYENLNYANVANGFNSTSSLFDRGLHYLCNSNTNNDFDFALPFDGDVHSIRKSQGLRKIITVGPNVIITHNAAGNRFSHTATSTDFLNDLPSPNVDYYYNVNDIEQTPLNFEGQFTPVEAIKNSCPVTYCEPPCRNAAEVGIIKNEFYISQSNELTAINQMELALADNNISLANQKQEEASYHKQNMDNDAFMVVLHVLYDTLQFHSDTLDVWIDNLDVLGMDLFSALKSQSEGKTEKAQKDLQKALNRNLNKSQNDDLADMPVLLEVLNNKSPYQLKKADIKRLEALAEKEDGFVGNISRNILALYGYRFPLTYVLPEKQVPVPTVIPTARELAIFPNPNSGIFNIQWMPTDEIEQQGVLHIMDVNGKIVQSVNVNTKEQYQLNLDAPTGIYFYQLNTTDGIIESGKLIIQ